MLPELHPADEHVEEEEDEGEEEGEGVGRRIAQRRDGGRKRALMRTRVDPQLFGYWQLFGEAIAPFM